MKANVILYTIAVLIVIVSFGAAILLPIPDSYRGLITLPGLGALFTMIFESTASMASRKSGHVNSMVYRPICLEMGGKSG